MTQSKGAHGGVIDSGRHAAKGQLAELEVGERQPEERLLCERAREGAKERVELRLRQVVGNGRDEAGPRVLEQQVEPACTAA